jgi:hypothetical protein
LDAGAFIAVDRNDRSMIARLRVAQLHGHELRTSAIVIAQVWRSPGGKQAGVARLLRAVDVRPVDEKMGRDEGALLARHVPMILSMRPSCSLPVLETGFSPVIRTILAAWHRAAARS